MDKVVDELENQLLPVRKGQVNLVVDWLEEIGRKEGRPTSQPSIDIKPGSFPCSINLPYLHGGFKTSGDTNTRDPGVTIMEYFHDLGITIMEYWP